MRRPERPRSKLVGPFGCRIDDLADFGDLACGKAAHLGVPSDNAFVGREINAENLVVGDIALDPLNVGPKLLQDAIGLGRGASKLLAVECADLWNFPLNYEPSHSHKISPLKDCPSSNCPQSSE